VGETGELGDSSPRFWSLWATCTYEKWAL